MSATGMHQVARETQPAGVRGWLTPRPVCAAVLLTVAFIAAGSSVAALATALVPPVQQLPDFITQAALIGALIALVSALGWWRVVGFNRPSAWRALHVLWLPAATMLVLPLVKGIALPSLGTLIFWIVGYALTGFYEETLMRGVVLRVVRMH